MAIVRNADGSRTVGIIKPSKAKVEPTPIEKEEVIVAEPEVKEEPKAEKPKEEPKPKAKKTTKK